MYRLATWYISAWLMIQKIKVDYANIFLPDNISSICFSWTSFHIFFSLHIINSSVTHTIMKLVVFHVNWMIDNLYGKYIDIPFFIKFIFLQYDK